MPSKGVTHPYPARALMADLDFMVHRGVILKSDQEPSIVALCDTVKNGWNGEILCLKHLPRARARSTERSNVFNLCMDLRGPSKTSWNNNLESRWSREVCCWLGWSSIVPIFSYCSTSLVTLPTCVDRQAKES